MRSLVLLGMLALSAVTLSAGAVAETNPVRTHPHSLPAASAPQFIIKLRGTPAGSAAREARQRVAAVAGRAGISLQVQRPITSQLYVLRVEPQADSAATTLARLRADPDLEYAELDQRRYIHAMPDDTLFTQQWFLQTGAATPTSAATPSAVDALDAWSTTTGSRGTVIADIDTGVRVDHPDLSARLLPGYCFISDPFVANLGTSGDICPGPGAVDTGDWVTQQDVTNHPSECSKATPEPSSWHGTRVAGILGAATNNNLGVAGVTWNPRLLPVRAVGKCGGLDSDIISGMLWAAGITVSGAPANPNPAKIINLSLGATGSCLKSYQDAIDQITALGILVVVSAGNEGGPVDAPANCLGVAGVAGLRQAGTKVGYSSLGPQISLAAPAGNCGNSFTGALGSACVYSMLTTTNLGYQLADANDYTGEYYCDPTTGSDAPLCTLANSNQYRTYNIGTSFSAPVVSGIAALMSAVNSKLNSCQLITRLEEGSTPFPETSLDAVGAQPPLCHVPANANDLQSSECICTQQTCGAGMANAPGALSAALRPIAAAALPAAVSAGASVALDGSGSAAANGHSITSYQWSAATSGVALTISGATSARASVKAPACGIGTVQLTVTDDAGRADTADVIIRPSSATTSAPSQAGEACLPSAALVQVAVCPASATVQAGGGSESFTATLANTSDAAVTWQVNGVTGGNSLLGTISTTGVYTAPASVPTSPTVTITAVSVADSSASSSASVTISGAVASGAHSGGGAIDALTVLLGALLLLARGRSRGQRWPEQQPG